MMAGFGFYWMTNKEWFYFDDDDIGEAHLTDKATPEAIESFKEYQKILEWDRQNPNIIR